jgi:hypothetical protein
VSIDNGARSSEPPLDLDAAEKLDQRIQCIADTAARNLDTLAELLSEAQAGHIHEVLGFPSWTEYVAARLKPITKTLGREELRALITELYDAGISVHAIAEAVDTSKSTVSRQVSKVGQVMRPRRRLRPPAWMARPTHVTTTAVPEDSSQHG